VLDRCCRLLTCVVVSLGALAAPAAAQQPADLAQHSLRAPVTDEHFYFVMADRFENGATANDTGGLGDDPQVSGFDPTHKGYYHGGDLRGLRSRLDYIRGLGTTAIWLTPSFKNRAVQPEDRSAGYHGYWITDFTQIDPHLGTNAELGDLVEAAHARGMKVYFDIITNHTADVIAYRQGARLPYVSKDVAPYKDAAGTVFDDRDYAGTDSFPAMSPETSFPFTPFVPADRPTKVPDWLNDLTLYHNRGDTTFVGENSLYGDFFGLDDLFTENPRVVRGMIDIYKRWITDFRIDGFRIDTMKHVDDAFWQKFAPEVLAHARAQGVEEFMMFGEVADNTRPVTSHYTTQAKVQSVLDFPFQTAAQNFAAGSQPTRALQEFFAGDDWYTDADSNVYQLPTFLGNHDMGRIGRFIRVANPTANDAEVLARDRLAHELMYLSRGNPTVYYGDEQGFVGDGGDQDARQDMFPSRVATYNDDDLIGTDGTTAVSNFDRAHPLYQSIRALARLAQRHPALRDGAHQVRYSGTAPGVFAFSRIDRADQVEYVVVLNNAERVKTSTIQTWNYQRAFRRIYGEGEDRLRSDSARRLRVTVQPLSAVVYRAVGRIPSSTSAPASRVTVADPVRDRVEVSAQVQGASFYDVSFVARAAGGEWELVGTDDTAPYRVFDDVADLRAGTQLEYAAVVLDNRGHKRQSPVVRATVDPPGVVIDAPAENANARDVARLSATVTPELASNVVTWERAVGDGPWTTIGTDDSSPVYSVVDDFSALGLATGTELRYRATVDDGRGGVATSAVRTLRVAPPPLATAIVHYRRPGGDYTGWGLHLWGDAIADGVATDWAAPRPPTRIENGEAIFEIPLSDDTKPVNFIVHTPGGDVVPDTREPGGDRSFIPLDHPEIWLLQGDPGVFFSAP
jgi:glycosidase